ncbi:flagellar hook-length control protein FliK, partial [Falsiroseomonas oryzae]|uniref:flagellar hook-length control protein FliK n=1 Tax=Falsiroseomonas oryzae TaxID=2766473 RepID=UPI0022EA891F
LSLTLEPAELGRVEVAVERSGAEAHVSLRAERPETLALLQRDRAELERALSDAGLSGGAGGGPSLSFGLGGEGGATRDQRGGGQPGRSGPQPAEPTAVLPLQAAGPRSLIDLAV